jgi:hypothetical protein
VSRRVLLPALALAACAGPAYVEQEAPPAQPGQQAQVSTPSGPAPAPFTRSAPTTNGRFLVTLEGDPPGPPLNQPFSLRLRAEHALPESLAAPIRKVQFDALMPDHDHGMQRTPRLTQTAPGEYLVEGLLFHMRGRWVVLVDVFAGTASGQATFSFEVGAVSTR